MVFVASLSIAYATYVMTSNTVNVTVNPIAATLMLVSNATSLTVGDSITLTATASDGATCAGIAVNFKDGATTIATLNMNSVGAVTYTYVPTVGSHAYTAVATHP